ncbi:MAG: hypothetical protein IH586_11905, partial [Anaerolineaceae bacterium]|nr:hypothetical protein [Anaerolineaceae bacterium]
SQSQSKFAFGRMLAREFGFDEELIRPASYLLANMRAPLPNGLILICTRLSYALGEEMPAQLPELQQFVELFRQGYPQSLRAVFTEP